MWILGLILAGVVTSLIVMLIKGGLQLVFGVLGVITHAIIEAIGLVLSGMIWALAGIAVGVILAVKFLYKKITTKPTDVDEFTTWKWMEDAELPRD